MVKAVLIYAVLPVSVVCVSLTLGRFHIGFMDMLTLCRLRCSGAPLGDYEIVNTVLFHVRLPRILGALLVGSALSLSGTVYQSLFRNPMVSPGILGVATGAGFGAAVGILLSMTPAGIQVMAFVFGLLAVGCACAIGHAFGKNSDSILILVLSGMVIGTIFSSCISLTKYVADPDDKLPAITFWLMGSLSSLSMNDVYAIAIPIIAGSLPLLLLRWKLNVLAFGDEEARSMGVDTKKIRLLMIVCSTVITAAAISVSGIIGWIGLIIPHICRMIAGPNHDRLVPLSMVVGAIYLVVVDDVARTVASIEIPLGIITSLIGAPFFMYLMFKRRRVW